MISNRKKELGVGRMAGRRWPCRAEMYLPQLGESSPEVAAVVAASLQPTILAWVEEQTASSVAPMAAVEAVAVLQADCSTLTNRLVVPAVAEDCPCSSVDS